MSKKQRSNPVQVETTAAEPVAEVSPVVASAPVAKTPKPYLNLKEMRHTALKIVQRLDTQLKYDPSLARATELGLIDRIRATQAQANDLAEACQTLIDQAAEAPAPVAAEVPAAV